jgi:hypothetical protein
MTRTGSMAIFNMVVEKAASKDKIVKHGNII